MGKRHRNSVDRFCSLRRQRNIIVPRETVTYADKRNPSQSDRLILEHGNACIRQAPSDGLWIGPMVMISENCENAIGCA